MKTMAGDTQRIVLLGTAILLTMAAVGGLWLSGWLRSGDEGPGGLDSEAVPQALIPPPPEYEGGNSVVPPGLTPPPEVTPPPPTHITIKGEQVPLTPGMTYYSGGTTICEGAPCPPGVFTRVRYDSKPEEAGWSWLVFDEDFALRGSQIRPEDQEEFQPLLDAFAAP